VKVEYPGPAVDPASAGQGTYHPPSGIQLERGVNEVEPEWAEKMLASGLVKIPDGGPVIETVDRAPEADVPARRRRE